MRLLFASQNKHKLHEIKPLLPVAVELISLAELNYYAEIPETSPTLAGNALQKAQFIFDKFQIPCFADDTGLEIDALHGRPGVYSARYAGEGKSADDNISKILNELIDVTQRTAAFKTIIALVGMGKPMFFEGVVKGSITTEKTGTNGFGYDPVFMPEGYSKTFAQMTLEEKNNLSHRSMAVKKFVEYLKSLPPAFRR
jgi:XTP/dITP diphosphohydrolase